ncbi:hypothetical protein ACIQZD_13660 [Peribacillus sp. NPDC096447]|uniref:hypothetical protein n=1 Tax=Peribacillus sp. NPDC096447 TaxID=3364394 RepID=UPI00380E4FFD
MDIIRSDVDFDYNGKVIPARIDTYYYKEAEKGENVVFTYNGVTVNVSFDKDVVSFETVAKKECSLIDELGQDYKTFDKYRRNVNKIRKNHIVINDKVYDHYYNDTIRSGSLIYYMMGITMKDGQSIDGSSPSEFFYEEDRKSKTKTFYNLTNKVKNYYKEKGIEPEDRYLNEGLTKEYVEQLSWIRSRVKSFI